MLVSFISVIVERNITMNIFISGYMRVLAGFQAGIQYITMQNTQPKKLPR